MIEKYSIRTDLALEQKERFEADNVEIPGVILEEENDEDREIRITTVKIETEKAGWDLYHDGGAEYGGPG